MATGADTARSCCPHSWMPCPRSPAPRTGAPRGIERSHCRGTEPTATAGRPLGATNMSVNVAGTGDLILSGSRSWGSSTVYGTPRSCWWWKQKSWRSAETCACSVSCCQRTMPFRVDVDARTLNLGATKRTSGRARHRELRVERDKGLSDEADSGLGLTRSRGAPSSWLRLRKEWCVRKCCEMRRGQGVGVIVCPSARVGLQWNEWRWSWSCTLWMP